MSRRYHVDTAGNLESMRMAINVAWRATPEGSTVTHLINGVVVGTENAMAYAARHGIRPPELVGDDCLLIALDGTAALDLSAVNELHETMINAQLGKTLGDVSTPKVTALIQVSRPFENGKLPSGVRDLLDDRTVDIAIDIALSQIGTPEEIADSKSGKLYPNEGIARMFAQSQVETELQVSRATAALARKAARDSKTASDRELKLRR
jgi:hypothetical protein